MPQGLKSDAAFVSLLRGIALLVPGGGEGEVAVPGIRKNLSKT